MVAIVYIIYENLHVLQTFSVRKLLKKILSSIFKIIVVRTKNFVNELFNAYNFFIRQVVLSTVIPMKWSQ